MRPRLSRRVLVGLAAVAVVIAGAVVGILTVPSAQASNNGLSITPAMGWSSWSFVRRTPTEAKIIAQADAMKTAAERWKGDVPATILPAGTNMMFGLDRPVASVEMPRGPTKAGAK